MTKNNLLRPSIVVLLGALMSGGLAGCDQKKDVPVQATNAPALPLTTGPAAPVVAAPAAAALPSAPRVRVGHVLNQSDRYAYVDRAYEMSNAIGQAPPDYDFDYGGVHAWVWRSSNREVKLVEPVENGYRYYYFGRGASEPYLVRDQQYSYGFSDGQLVAVYDDEGRLLSPRSIDQRTDDAGRYLARATELYKASLRSERRSVNAANWAARRAELDAERSRWEAQQNEQDAWRSYHAEHEAEDQAYWQEERDHRDRSARSFNDWQSRGYDGPPPPPVDYSGHDERNGPPGQRPGSSRSNGPGDDGRSALPPIEPASQADAAQQAQAKAAADASAHAMQKAQADAAQQAQAKAAAEASARALQKARADAAQQAQVKAATDASARAQLKARADAAQQAQAKAAADASARAQQKAQADAAQQAQAKAAADASARAQQKARADAVLQAQAKAAAEASTRAQQKARADAVLQAQAKAAADASARAQQKAQADAAQQAQAKAAADAAARAQQKAQADADAARAHAMPSILEIPKPPQALPDTGRPTKEEIAARRAAAKKAHDHARTPPAPQ